MHDPNRLVKWLLIVALVVCALWVLYPPSEKLKGGIDLVGGSSLLYEIDTTGLDPSQIRGLSTRVMEILRERVDPKGQLNLEWRPVGDRRLEIRMPRPPKEAIVRRDAYNAVLDEIKTANIRKIEVELALNAEPAVRDQRLAELERGISVRTALITAARDAFDQRAEAVSGRDDAAIDAATTVYGAAVDALLETSLPLSRFKDVLGLEDRTKRQAEFDKLAESHADYSGDGGLMARALSAHQAWSKDRADLEDPEDLKRLIRGAGVLEFRILATRDPEVPTQTKDANPRLSQPIGRYTEQLAKYGPRQQAGDDFAWLLVTDLISFLDLKNLDEFELQKGQPGSPIVEEYAGTYYVLMHDGPTYRMLQRLGSKSWALKSAFPNRNQMTGENTVDFLLDYRGGQLFGELTGENVGRSLAIMLDNEAMSHAVIQGRIGERCQISGRFSMERAQNLVRVLDAGSLPARLKEPPLQEKTIGPSLGETNRRMGMQAAIGGCIAVAVFMLVYYGFAGGGMANIALTLNMLFVLAVMALMQATFTLPGIAGLILTVGMAVDANVLIFERFREERDRGTVFKKALNLGYDRAFSTIMDANLTTLITCVILGFVGSEEVKGFAITLGIGISTSMFTALFVTRLVFNTLIAKGWLKDLRMLRIIHVPSIDWLALRSIFWPVSLVLAIGGLALFVGLANYDAKAVFDIEFLGGTSVQIDLKPGEGMSDDEIRRRITSPNEEDASAVAWLMTAADRLSNATVEAGDVPTRFTLRSDTLTGEQLGTLMQAVIGERLERGGIQATAHAAMFDGKSGQLDRPLFEAGVTAAAERALEAASRLRGARIQSVGDVGAEEGESGLSYEIVTVETNSELVKVAILAALGEKLSVQRSLAFTLAKDDEMTKEAYFIVEADDHYLSDVIGGDATFDIRQHRGGVVVHVQFDAAENPVTVKEVERRLLEVGLQAQFQDFLYREAAVYPLGPEANHADGGKAYSEFAIVVSDDVLLFEDDELQWAELLAEPQVQLVEAGLGREKSLSKVVQFAPQIAGQTQNRAIFAIVMAFGAIVLYVWLRFGNKEFGLAAIVALVHDVALTLGAVAVSHFVSDTFFGTALLIDGFRLDLPMVAAILTVIGYSLNDTIVVFDRIRENRGKSGALTPGLINMSINQTLSRTILTSATTFLVVLILYCAGGKGVHGFAYTLLIGVVVGTYSSLGIATPLLYRQRVLKNVITTIIAAACIGMIIALTADTTVRLVLCGFVAIGFAWALVKLAGAARLGAGNPVRA